MAVQFKFRSSANFDSVDIDGRPSISVRDLKSKIIRHKNLNICQDSDLVFSDAVTGKDYTDENIQIPCGSSVIIKRVPAGSVHIDMPLFNSCQNLHSKGSADFKSTVAANAETVNFDDFGVDLFAIPKATSFSSDFDAAKDACIQDCEPKTDIGRHLEAAVGGWQKLEASGLSDAVQGGHAHSGVEHTIPQTKSKPEEEDMKLEKVASVNPLDTRHADLSSELKCSLCNSFFKEAMMIPCCQHSFCEKCICQVLLEKARCPKCFSAKCRVEDLLPNVSLRQAIEHFLESQNLITVPDNAFCQYAPDGESGIQAKDVSCGGTIFQRESELPHSPETGMGSNHFFAESAYNSPFKKDAPNHLRANNFLRRHGSTNVVPDVLAAFDDFQGETKPMHERAEREIMNKRPPWVYAAGGDKRFLGTGKQRKGERTCYMCGSPDHLIRDCPVASSPHPMLHGGNSVFPGAMPGYVPPYWNGAPSPNAQPFRNLYGNHVMTAFDASLVHPPPLAVPTYMPAMYSSFPAFGGNMRMRGAAPLPGTGEDYHLSCAEFQDLQGREKRRKFSNDNFRRERSHDDDEDLDLNVRRHYNGTERLHDHKYCINREKSISHLEDGSTKGFQRKYRHHNYTDDDWLSVDGQRKSSRLVVGGRDQKLYHRTERSSSEVDDRPSSSSFHSEEKHKRYHRSSRKHKEKREQWDSDSSMSHHQNTSKKFDSRKRIEHDFKRHTQKHHSHSGSGLEQSVSNDKKLKKESSHNSRHSKHSEKSDVDKLSHNRRKMACGSDEDGADGYQYCRPKRKH